MSTPRHQLLASAPWAYWRDVLAIAAAALTVACASGGLIVLAPVVQLALLAALTAGLIAPSVRRAALAGAVGCAVGLALGPASAWYGPAELGSRIASGLASVAFCAAAAAGVRWALKARPATGRVFVWLALALLIGNLWYTTLSANTESTHDPITGVQMPSFNEQIAGDTPATIAMSDDAWWYRLLLDVRAGKPYYPALAAALEENPRWEPASVMDFRMPTLYYLWRLLPDAGAVVPLFLLFATCGILALVPIAKGFVRLPLVIPAAAAVASYFQFFPVQISLFSQEAWAAAIGLLSFAAFAVSLRSGRWKAFTIAAVLFAVAATLVRETIAFLPLAGLASAFLFEGAQRGFRATAWGAGVAALGGAYLVHYLNARPYVVPAEGFGRLGKGGLSAVASAVTYGTDFLGSTGVLAALLAVAGIVGAVLLRDTALRAFVLGTTGLTLASFLVLGNSAWYETTGMPVNYWGASVMPLVYATVPLIFTLVPGAAVKASGAVAERCGG